MPQNTEPNENESITATFAVDSAVKALKLNATHGTDDRVIAVPQRDGAEASIRRAFRGSERYSNPQAAPVHIRPEELVEDAWTRPPRRDQVDTTTLNVPELVENRDEDDERRVDTAHDELLEVWETDVRGMIDDEHEFEAKGITITLAGSSSEDDE